MPMAEVRLLHSEEKKVRLNPFPNNKFLDWSKLEAFADKKINVVEKLKLVLGRVDFPTMFSKVFFFKVVKS